MINIEHLFFKYGDELVLEDINLHIQPKDFIAIMGPNGGGKSTLLKIILGLHTLQKGRITIDDKDYAQSQQSIGYVPQYIDYNLDFSDNGNGSRFNGYKSLKTTILGIFQKRRSRGLLNY